MRRLDMQEALTQSAYVLHMAVFYHLMQLTIMADIHGLYPFHQSNDYRIPLDREINKAFLVLSTQLSAFDVPGFFHHATGASATQYPKALVELPCAQRHSLAACVL